MIFTINNKKFIFCHIQKCGGSSIEYIFKDYILYDKINYNVETNNMDFELYNYCEKIPVNIIDKSNKKLKYLKDENNEYILNKNKDRIVYRSLYIDTKHLYFFDKNIAYTYNIYGKDKMSILNSSKEAIKYSDYIKFSIVRNPYTRLLSWYYWIKKEGVFKFDDFYDFLNQKKRRWNLTQTSAIIYYDDKIKQNLNVCDYLIKFENYSEDYLNFLKKYNLDEETFKLTTINKISKKKNLNEFTQECLDYINKVHKEDFDNFDYEIITDIKNIQNAFDV